MERYTIELLNLNPMPVTTPRKAQLSSRRSRGTTAGIANAPQKVSGGDSRSPEGDRAALGRAPPPLIRRTLQHNVYDYLRDSLATGELGPGERLTIRGVAERIGTSIMPVREAFRRLTSEGALEPLSSGATRVPVLDFKKLQDLFEIRLSVEGLAARLAANRITESQITALV